MRTQSEVLPVTGSVSRTGPNTSALQQPGLLGVADWSGLSLSDPKNGLSTSTGQRIGFDGSQHLPPPEMIE